MPIKWYGSGDNSNPTYAHFSRVVNLVLHGMGFAAVNSGLWFYQGLSHPWRNLNVFTEIWLLALMIHLVYVISKRPEDSQA